jgi:hypothetical protein
MPKQDPAGSSRVEGGAGAYSARSQAGARRLHELVIPGVGGQAAAA